MLKEADNKMEKEHENISKHIIHKTHKRVSIITKPIIILIILVAVIILFNQFQIYRISGMATSSLQNSGSGAVSLSSGNKDLADIDLAGLKSTGHTIQAVFSLGGLDGGGVMGVMFPTGTPDYGKELGVSYDEPIDSLATLARMYRGLMAEVQQNNPEGWQRFMNLALKPVGISCEHWCGVGPIGIRKDGSSACGCQHNPALLSVALYLSAYTDYTDGEILREVMKWKTLFFPKKMIELGTSLAGGDTSALDNLPGMVGGC